MIYIYYSSRLEEMREMMARPPHNPVPASKDPFHERLPWFHMVGRASVSLTNLTRFLHDFLYTDKIPLYIILLYSYSVLHFCHLYGKKEDIVFNCLQIKCTRSYLYKDVSSTPYSDLQIHRYTLYLYFISISFNR